MKKEKKIIRQYNLAVNCFQNRQYNKSIRTLKKLLNTNPKFGIAWNLLGVIYRQQKQVQKAVFSLKKAVALEPGNAIFCNSLGNAFKDAGCFSKAVASFQKAVSLMPDYFQAYNNLAIVLKKLNRLEEAVQFSKQSITLNPDYAQAYFDLAGALVKMNRLDQAVENYLKAISILPGFVQASCDLGICYTRLGEFEKARVLFEQSLAAHGDRAELLQGMAELFSSQEDWQAAEKWAQRAVKADPHRWQAANQLASILIRLNRFEEARSLFEQTIKAHGDRAELLYGMAKLFFKREEWQRSEEWARRAVNARPDWERPHIKRSYALQHLGRSDEAFKSSLAALEIAESDETKALFANCISRIRFTSVSGSITGTLIRAMSEGWSRPGQLVNVAVQILKLQQELSECISRATTSWPKRLNELELYGAKGLGAVSADALLCCTLEFTLIPDIAMEKFFTMARHVQLDAALNADVADDLDQRILAFYVSIARQCFINEYVYDFTKPEIAQAQILKDKLISALKNGDEIPALWPVAVAAYFSLFSLPFTYQLLDRSWPGKVGALLVQQVREPEEELQYRKTIHRLTKIDDEISVRVKEQYEENPYPRWVKTASTIKPMACDKYFRQLFPLVSIKPLNKQIPEILIAGCGTGQQSIERAQVFTPSTVLSIDLSLASIGYAVRKTREAEISSLTYYQADILELGTLDRNFDIIESVGVLHHLEDPLEGWKILLSKLRADGFMKIGLYSQIARRDIIRARSFIREQGYESIPKDIRRCRSRIMDLECESRIENVMNCDDFFSLSMCRDLLFHVQEHLFSLPGITSFLRDNHLEFLGFVISPQTLAAYKHRFSNDPSAINLDQWDIFEQENPDTFWGMYQFWVQKKE